MTDTTFFKVAKISDINLDQIVRQLPGAPLWNSIFGKTQGKYVEAFLQSEDMLEQHGLNTTLRLAHFLGQGLIETGFLRYTSENLNYSAPALRKVFGKYFPTDAEAEAYARQPEKIANKVYGNRMGNGDEASGDGWKYRGRGFIQLTGKNNYTKYALLTGLPIDIDPDLLSRDLKASIQVAAKFFEVNNLLQYADLNDAKKVSRGINFGNPNSANPAHGEADRIWWTEKAFALFSKEEAELVSPRAGGVLKIGSRGALVEEFQRLLAGLDYPVGGIDGDYGPATSRVVVAFQQQAGLPTTGDIDKVTALAIDDAASAVPAASSRTHANVNDVRATGTETPNDTNQIGAGGAVIVVAAGAAAASEFLGGESTSKETPSAERVETPINSAARPEISTDANANTNTGISVPDTSPVHPSSGTDGPNWILIGALVIIAATAIWMFTRAGKIKKDQVQDYRDGKIV